MAEVKRALGITPYVEFKQSLSHGWEVVGSKLRGLQDSQGSEEYPTISFLLFTSLYTT